MEDDQSARLSASVIARALTDEEFKARLIDDPAATFRAEGIDLPDDVTITVVENSPTQAYIVLPDPATLSDEYLAAASGGSTASTAGTAGTVFCSCAPGTAGTVGTAGSVS